MTFSPRPRLFAKIGSIGRIGPSCSAWALAVAVACLALASSGCEDKHIGRACDLQTDDPMITGTTMSSTVNSQAVECPTRICLLPAGDKTSTTGPLCTAGCSSDDDCDGETTKDALDTKHCHTGFTCMIATTVGNFCCERLCVCKDFIDTTIPGYNAKPPVCNAGTTTCKNVH
jgi:hypothetical protein